jgi:AcrR family transcriptional regulator
MAQAVSSKKAGKPARDDGYALRARILRNAADVYGKLGAADTTVEHILVASEVSRRTFYRFFKSKEDVLDALHEIGCNILLAAAAQSSKLPGDPIVRLSKAIEAYVEYHVTVGTNVMHVVQGESMRPGSRLEPRRRAFLDSMVEMFEREMNAATGLHVDPMLLRSLLIALEGVSLMLRVEAQTNGFELDRAKRVMLRMVMAAVAAPEGGGVPPLPVTTPPKPKRKKRSG